MGVEAFQPNPRQVLNRRQERWNLIRQTSHPAHTSVHGEMGPHRMPKFVQRSSLLNRRDSSHEARGLKQRAFVRQKWPQKKDITGCGSGNEESFLRISDAEARHESTQSTDDFGEPMTVGVGLDHRHDGPVWSGDPANHGQIVTEGGKIDFRPGSQIGDLGCSGRTQKRRDGSSETKASRAFARASRRRRFSSITVEDRIGRITVPRTGPSGLFLLAACCRFGRSGCFRRSGCFGGRRRFCLGGRRLGLGWKNLPWPVSAFSTSGSLWVICRPWCLFVC